VKTIVEKIEFSKDIIARAVDEFYPNIAAATSFGKDSMVMLSLLHAVRPEVRIFTVMTKHKPVETFKFYDFVSKLWDLDIPMYMSGADIPNDLWKSDPDECCEILKVIPTKRAIREMELNAWITGLRCTEGRTRIDYRPFERGKLELDDGTVKVITKINPILDWTETDIWKYTAFYEVPINPLYRLGYRSLGCITCSRIIDDSDTERAGRWQDTSKCGGECGIHTMGEGRLMSNDRDKQ
jgi:phosphoadenosine phosphosulfate reductase